MKFKSYIRSSSGFLLLIMIALICASEYFNQVVHVGYDPDYDYFYSTDWWCRNTVDYSECIPMEAYKFGPHVIRSYSELSVIDPSENQPYIHWVLKDFFGSDGYRRIVYIKEVSTSRAEFGFRILCELETTEFNELPHKKKAEILFCIFNFDLD